ncbi:hypothetical protein TNCV_1121661 [Trichonephila clavipes]|nr:hypothetical protein TNCV_1121661 [Trichonephila clavipes]
MNSTSTNANAADDIQQEYKLKNQEVDTVKTVTCNPNETSNNLTVTVDTAVSSSRKPNKNNVNSRSF